MSIFKNNPDITLYYSDTDSVIVDKELNPKLMGSQIGLLKLECQIRRFVSIAAKFYIIETMDGEIILKVKGLNLPDNTKLNFKTVTDLLTKETSIEMTQEKWYKSIFSGGITIREMLHHLAQSCSKRKQIFVTDD